MFTIFTVVLISTGLIPNIATSPVPTGSGIYQNFFQGDIKLSDVQKEMLLDRKLIAREPVGLTHFSDGQKIQKDMSLFRSMLTPVRDLVSDLIALDY